MGSNIVLNDSISWQTRTARKREFISLLDLRNEIGSLKPQRKILPKGNIKSGIIRDEWDR